ncbi:MAG TPA: sugar ABC transporter permease [Candidatus Limiplasma sp.]|nr:sugar ABC transporter permease [Candidatus Limiplasma sp.]HPS80228.1 sugar ABC transporter permease [Candidatus Limiplasma sp.]
MNNVKSKIKGNLKQYSMLLALVVIIIFFHILTGGRLLKPMNVSNIVFQNAYVVILAVGMLLCILTGGNIDLAVGSVVALVGACAGQFIIVWHWNVYLSIAMCLVIGILVGAWQGFWIAYVRIPAFIVTLSGQLVFRGLTLLILNGLTLAPFPDNYLMFSTGFIAKEAKIDFLGASVNIVCLLTGVVVALIFCIAQIINQRSRKRKGYETDSTASLTIKMVIISAALIWFFTLLAQYQGIPSVLIILGILLVVYTFFTTKTVVGRHLYALGGNEKAARLSGVKTNHLMFFAYVNMSFLAAVAGLVFAARLNSASPVTGTGFELDAIGACFIGGASAYGGIGTVGGTLIGALIMGMLNNGMSIMGISSNLQQVVKGLVLLGAVAFDVISKMNLDFMPKRKKPTVATQKG